ncbi:MAG: PrsW family glutamic-type intramembrane protease, partial [Patescibacteria group bacterium]|nr:PrsW family glutamic-type intramembrane protease [Patescibacteria group bacterium]
MLNYLFYLLGFLPSFAWLLFYLRKDSHPESNSTVIKIFALGMLAGFFAILLERSFQKIHAFFSGSISTETILYIFVGVALIEELVKFLAVRLTVFRSVEFDEPLDLMLYMIIVALGFAALENILVLGNEHLIGNFWKSLEIMGSIHSG